MKLLIGSLIGLVLSLHVGAAPLLEGRVRLSSGRPAAGVQVRLFDLTDVRQFVGTTTDEAGYFALPLQTLSTGSALPDGFTLGQNYPNPFNPSTIIPYQLPVASHVRLEVLNMLGQHLATLVDGERSAGMHTAQWDATDAAGRAVGAGVYVYRLSGGGLTVSRRMVLVDGQAGIPAVGTIPQRQVRVAEPVAANSPVYGLTVSGADLIPYINPAFQVGVEADIVIEEYGGAAFRLMKRAAGGILGDVNGDGLVDIADALFVAMYSINSSALEAHIPNISLGDVDADGDIDFTDAYLIGTYSVNPSDPALPPGIGQAVPDSESSVSETSENQDTVLSHIYWTDIGRGEIQRTNLNGSNIETLITGSESPAGLALDMDGGKIYWTDASPNAPSTGKIQRTDLDGSNTKTLITGLENPFSIALDVERGRIYWTDIGTASIQRANLDGSNIETLITGTGNPTGVALDVEGGKIYWTDGVRYRIQRANLDGSNTETLITGLENPAGIALDVDEGKIYWTDTGSEKIQRANLDGSNTETLITGLENPTDIALDVEGGKIYWIDEVRYTIQRANLDGSNIRTLVGGVVIFGIALDVERGKIYWTDGGRYGIQRANLDGSNVETLITELGNPTGIALDMERSKIYWTDEGTDTPGTGTIQRANLDGSNVETFITELGNPTSIALDVEGSKIYWTDEGTDTPGTGTIQRANLDGSSVETFITGLETPAGIALAILDSSNRAESKE